MLKHKLFTPEQFGMACGLILGTAKTLWSQVTEIAIDAVLHYHESSYDTTRPQKVYDMLGEARLGSLQTAYVNFLRESTGITGIGKDAPWKHNKGNLEECDETWEAVLLKAEAAGLGQFMPEKTAKVSKVKQKAKTAVQVPEGTSDAVKNALQVTLDKIQNLPEAEQLSIVSGTGGENPLNAIKSAVSRAEMDQLLQNVVAMEVHVEQDKAGKETGPDKNQRILRQTNSIYADSLRGDWQAVVDQAANDALAEVG